MALLATATIRSSVVREVDEQTQPEQLELEGVAGKPDIEAIVRKTIELVSEQTIDIPRILVVPKGEVASGYRPFELDLSSLRYPPISEELWVQLLRTGRRVACLTGGGLEGSMTPKGRRSRHGPPAAGRPNPRSFQGAHER